MNYLIATEPDDTHAILAKLALEEKGHKVRFLYLADHPTRQINSVFIHNGTYEWFNSDKLSHYHENHYDVVWWRRVRRPYIPKNLSHPEDYKFITRENYLFYEGITYNLAPNAWWINNKEAATRANSKLLQLKTADSVGLKIPVSLFSNNPQEIRQFITAHINHGVIYKPLCSNFWFEPDQIKISYTTKVDLLDLPDDQALQLTPGIYQRQLQKKYELRITCFGDYIIAAKLDSQAHKEGQIDWRAISNGDMRVELYLLPKELEEKINFFMKKMGLETGSLDFIVTPENEYVFLEVNEQGQFLWIEELCPEIPMLNTFVDFMENKKVTTGITDRTNHSIEQYRCQMGEMVLENLKHHVDLNSHNLPL
ncbi:Glutathione synthase/Ribosomal protein S6 modification enzyme (glutaminyl transferase) (plasmid) [Legionella adelaidensis]|uniref:Glutathione synthase/Ribosomal protein S6 modification enzyme (Glutaminyl transferase) n=1 Tax=Legionella adelaidensis TaxID=45056 RepID=A0A0W0R1A7_9GAMM|nr:hypothetical protein [Legionella adelaidensis]KTC64810.1 hypothetical protein Lade_2104 [Legionella adelaidensis]VEH86200.1 Glutathione synthase/Ribosomal protein S6 modification enzyme (glutaminyl transferase) [Legionella adelaidensis]